MGFLGTAKATRMCRFRAMILTSLRVPDQGRRKSVHDARTQADSRERCSALATGHQEFLMPHPEASRAELVIASTFDCYYY